MLRKSLLAFGFVVAAIVLGAMFLDEGEVVKLHTLDGEGTQHETLVWIVDLSDGSYLRSGESESGWIARIRQRPEVEIERDDATSHFEAVPLDDTELREAVNMAMAEKYGLADRLIMLFLDPSASVPVRLTPIAGHGQANAPH